MENNRILIIAGMHRSGTSLITQWLYRCGLFVGNDLFPADVGNVEGHFEDVDFLNLHQEFLVKRNCVYTGFIDKPFAALVDSEKQQLKELIIKRNSQHSEWGWKDPRTCLFLDVYNELIPSAYYLFIVRDHRSAISSMLSREYKVHIKKFRKKRGLSKLKWILYKKKSPEKIFAKHAEHFLRVWIHYYEQILERLNNLDKDKYLVVHYSCLVKDDKDVFFHLKKQWQFSLNYIPFTDIYKKELVSEVISIEQYIKDKDLLLKAASIDKFFDRYLCEREIRTPAVEAGVL